MNIKNTLQESPLTRKLYKNLSKKRKNIKRRNFNAQKNLSTEVQNQKNYA